MSTLQTHTTSSYEQGFIDEVRQIHCIKHRGESSAGPSPAHRLLTALADEGLVSREPKSARWSLGPELYLLSRPRSRGVRYSTEDTWPSAGGSLMPIATPEAYAEMLARSKERSYAFPAINCTSPETINGCAHGKRLEIPIKRILLGAKPADVVSPSTVDQPDLFAVFAEHTRG
jgi:hypothetical protein